MKKLASLILLLTTLFSSMPVLASIEIKESYNGEYDIDVLEIKDNDFILEIHPKNGLIVDVIDTYYQGKEKANLIKLGLTLIASVPVVHLVRLTEENNFLLPKSLRASSKIFVDVAISKKFSQQWPILTWCLNSKISNKILVILFNYYLFLGGKMAWYSFKLWRTGKKHANMLYNDSELRKRIDKACAEKGYISPYWPSLVRLK